MDTAIIVLICICLLLLFLLAFQYAETKKQIRRFTKEVNKLKADDYSQPIKVELFGPDLVALANALNEHIDQQQELSAQYIQNRQELSHIISGISHDFRTPLTALLGYLQMIEKSGELSSENCEYLKTAIQKSSYLKQLSDDFFEVSKIRQDTTVPELEIINLTSLLSEFILEQYEWIQAKGLDTMFELEEQVFVKSDRHSLERIFANLFSNTKKYAVHGIRVSLIQSGNRIVIQICNQVADQKELDLSRIFEAFYRADSRNSHGSGLGLYIAKCLCDKLGYNLEAKFEEEWFVVEASLEISDKICYT